MSYIVIFQYDWFEVVVQVSYCEIGFTFRMKLVLKSCTREFRNSLGIAHLKTRSVL